MFFRILFLAPFLISPVLAQEEVEAPAYQDDRSSAQALVQSFYNAINRGEYLRAWSYYDGNAYARDDDETAQADYASFRDGYEETASVTLLTGEPTDEGAAGSIYYYLPVAIDARNHDGTRAQFAGCYTLRLAQPSNQDAPPFHPMHIVSGTLETVKSKALDAVLPADCTP